jgi:hypothetical protein
MIESNFTVVCINISKLEGDGKTPTNLKNVNLTIGKHYIVIDSMDYESYYLYLIKDDLGLSLRYRSDQFMRLEEMRDKKLKELGI